VSQVKHVDEVGAKPIERTINQLVAKDQANLRLWVNILRMKCNFQRGIMLLRFSKMWLNRL